MSPRRPFAILCLATFVASLATMAAAQTPARPPEEFTQCATCHEVTPGGQSTGPTLFGVVGRKAATVPDFDYSPAMKAWGQTWTPENIRAYLLAPAKTIPGNKMDYDGAEDADTANVIIDFLKTLKP